MLDKQETLDFLRDKLRRGELYMFINEVAASLEAGKTIAHFNVQYYYTDDEGYEDVATFQVSYRNTGTLKSIQNFTHDFDPNQWLRGYSTIDGEYTLIFGDSPQETCICPMHTKVSELLHCTLCGYSLHEHAKAPFGTASGSNYPTVEELVQARYADQPEGFASFKSQAVADSLGLPLEDVQDILGLDTLDLEGEREFAKMLKWFGLPIDGSHKQFPYEKTFSFDEYVLLIQSLAERDTMQASIHTDVTHKDLITLMSSHVPEDLQVTLHLFSTPSVRVYSMYTKSEDFGQDFGQLFGIWNAKETGTLYTFLGVSANECPTPYGFTRLAGVAALLPRVYHLEIRLPKLTPTLNGAKLFPNSVIKVKHVRFDGTFIVTPAADDSREFELPHNFVGALV